MFTSYYVSNVGDFLFRQGPISTGPISTYVSSNTTSPVGYSSTSSAAVFYDDRISIPGLDLLKIKLPKYKEEDYPSYPKCRHSILDNGTNVLCFATTGFSRKELDVRIEDTTLIIKGCKERLADTEGNTKPEKEVYNSISQKNFEVAFKLSDKFDLAKVKPSYEDGLLTIKIPLSEEVQKRNKSLDIE